MKSAKHQHCLEVCRPAPPAIQLYAKLLGGLLLRRCLLLLLLLLLLPPVLSRPCLGSCMLSLRLDVLLPMTSIQIILEEAGNTCLDLPADLRD